MQHFVLLEGGCCWYLSSYIYIERVEQASGTFLGGVIGHTTSQSMLERVLDGCVTTLCPGDGSLLACGSDSKREKLKKLKHVI